MADPSYRRQFLYNADVEETGDEPLFGSNALYARQFAPDVSVPNFSAAGLPLASAPTLSQPQSGIPPPATSRPSVLSRFTRPFLSLTRLPRRNPKGQGFEFQLLRHRDRSANALLSEHPTTLDASEGDRGPDTLDISNVHYFFRTSEYYKP